MKKERLNRHFVAFRLDRSSSWLDTSTSRIYNLGLGSIPAPLTPKWKSGVVSGNSGAADLLRSRIWAKPGVADMVSKGEDPGAWRGA